MRNATVFLVILALGINGCANRAPSDSSLASRSARVGAVELDTDSNGATDIARGGTNATTAAGARANLGVPSSLAQLTDDTTHRTVSDAERSAWSAKQPALGFTAENTANKGIAGGYAALGGDGKVPSAQLPAQAATGDNLGSATYAEVVALWPGCSGYMRYDGTCGSPSAAPSWLPTAGPTADNQIIQATGAGTSAWTSVIDGLINDSGTGVDDLWSASKISTAIASATPNLSSPGPIGATTPSTGQFTTITASAYNTSAPAVGETGELGLAEDPANGNNIVSIKAPSFLAGDLVITLPSGQVPASATSACTAGQWWYDNSYWYVCVAANTWKRTALATW